MSREGQTWLETIKSRWSTHVFLILGEESLPTRSGEPECYYRILDLETGSVTRVIKAAVDEGYDNKHVKWERIA